MPQIYDGLLKHHPSFIAWRWAFFVPGSLHIIVSALVLFAATVSPMSEQHRVRQPDSSRAGSSCTPHLSPACMCKACLWRNNRSRVMSCAACKGALLGCIF